MVASIEQVRALLHNPLERDEGRVLDKHARHVVYDDATGKPLKIEGEGLPTVGYGRLLSRGFSEEEADFLLGNDIADARTAAMRYPWLDALNDARQCVVIALIFNMGPERFETFHNMRACLERGEFAGAARELLDSHYAYQVDDGPGGKPGRADRYARILQTGVWE